jgi:hypothetical protein
MTPQTIPTAAIGRRKEGELGGPRMTHIMAVKPRHAEMNPPKNRAVGLLNTPVPYSKTPAGGLKKIGGGLRTHQTPPAIPTMTNAARNQREVGRPTTTNITGMKKKQAKTNPARNRTVGLLKKSLIRFSPLGSVKLNCGSRASTVPPHAIRPPPELIPRFRC